MPLLKSQSNFRHLGALMLLTLTISLSGCASSPADTPSANRKPQVAMPLQQGWFEGQTVFYVTTDASDAAVAKDLNANFSPRLAYALPATTAHKNEKPAPSSVDKVYAFANFSQGSVFASAPKPMGYQNSESAYTPLWLMVVVTWKPGVTAKALTSEESVLDAQEKGWVTLASTGIIVNCPIISRGSMDSLPGVTRSP